MKTNALPSNKSNWFKFAFTFDIGTLDLDWFAYLMKFDNFNDLDISITPKSLFDRNKEIFATSLKRASIEAEDMTVFEIQNVINNL